MIQLIGLKGDVELEIREKFSVIQKRCEKFTKNLSSVCEEVIVISTCNRTEIYFNSKEHDENIANEIFDILGWDKSLKSHTFHYKEGEVIKYLMDVVCGFHSLILGEDQILAQIKEGYEIALDAKTVSKDLQRLFQIAVTCGKEFRTKSNLYKIPVSSSSIAVNESKKQGIKKFMLLGFGAVGQLAAKYILSTGFQVLYVAARNPKVVEIEDPRVKAIYFDERTKYYKDVDCIISCTSAPHCVVRKENLPEKNMIIFDLAVPRDVEQEVYSMENIKVYNIDKVSSIDDENRKKRKNVMIKNRCIINKHIKEFMDWQKIQGISGEILNLKKCGEKVYKKRYKTFKNKRYTKDNEKLAEILFKSTSDAFVNRAIDVLKEEQLKGSAENCMKIIKKIFYVAE